MAETMICTHSAANTTTTGRLPLVWCLDQSAITVEKKGGRWLTFVLIMLFSDFFHSAQLADYQQLAAPHGLEP